MLKSDQKKSLPYPLNTEPVLRIPIDPDSTGGSGSRRARENSKENMLAECSLWRADRLSWACKTLLKLETGIYSVTKSMYRKFKKTWTMSWFVQNQQYIHCSWYGSGRIRNFLARSDPDPGIIERWDPDLTLTRNLYNFCKFSFKMIHFVFDYGTYIFPLKILRTLVKSCSGPFMYT